MSNNKRTANWERLIPLFQSYVDTFGAELGGMVIDYIARMIGGYRISFPEKLTPITRHSESWVILAQFYDVLCSDLSKIEMPKAPEEFRNGSRLSGNRIGQVVMKEMFRRLKGHRISFVRLEEMHRIERDEKIRKERKEHGTSVTVLAERSGLDEVTIWRILREE
ncbi:MAG: hypothetical protein AB1553_01915 [Nitrospirota bacterium]